MKKDLLKLLDLTKEDIIKILNTADQLKYNQKHNITPHSVNKEISEGLRAIIPQKEKSNKINLKKIPREEYPQIIKELSSQMQLAAANLEFERAAELRDQIEDIKAALEGLQKDSGYLFGSEETPPAYAAGTGTGAYQGNYSSDSTLRAAMGLPVKNN